MSFLATGYWSLATSFCLIQSAIGNPQRSGYAFRVIFSIPPMYGRRALGTVMLPSAFW